MGFRRSFAPGTPAWVELETAAGTTPASRYYCGLFGWRVMARHRPADDYAGYWIFVQDNGDIGGLAPGRTPVWSVYISVEDVDEVTQAVVENGGTVLQWPLEVYTSGRLAVYGDPFGARFAAWEPAAHTGVDLMDEPNSFTWAELSTGDLDAAASFYGAVLGWDAGPDGFLVPGSPDPVTGLAATDGPAHWQVFFAVADVDETAERAVALGGTMTAAPAAGGDGERVAALRDPEGAAFSVRQAS